MTSHSYEGMLTCYAEPDHHAEFYVSLTLRSVDYNWFMKRKRFNGLSQVK